jgi:hypothetical protein
MSEEIKVEENKTSNAKNIFGKVWTSIVGLIVGVAAMLGVNQSQINAVKTDTTEAYKEVQAVIQAIQSKDYLKAIDAAKKAADKLKNVTGEVKEAVDTAKEGIEIYKLQIADLKAAAEANDYKQVIAIASQLSSDITSVVPADKLTGKQKELYDIVVQVNTMAAEQKFDPIIDLIGKISKLFSEKEDAPAKQAAPPAEN